LSSAASQLPVKAMLKIWMPGVPKFFALFTARVGRMVGYEGIQKKCMALKIFVLFTKICHTPRFILYKL
jgi:hypothetical protein